MRIEYRPIRRWTLFFLPSFLICALPDYLGITTPKEGWAGFRFWFDITVSVAFWGGIIYAVYAVIYNAKLETRKQ
jgi:hypothetical protein